MEDKLQEIFDAHARGEHFSWSNCPLCWAQRQIREMLSAPMISSIVLVTLLSCGVVEAGGIPTDCGSNGRQDCVMYGDPTLGLVMKPVEKRKQVIIPYDDFLVMVSKVEHKDKLLNQCAAERGILIKLNDENGTIKRLNLQQIEALEGEVEAHRKLGETQEQISKAVQAQLLQKMQELAQEKRLSRYKSEAFWIGVVAIGLWVMN